MATGVERDPGEITASVTPKVARVLTIVYANAILIPFAGEEGSLATFDIVRSNSLSHIKYLEVARFRQTPASRCVFLHGFTQQPQMWLDLATNLIEIFPLRCDLLFLPGHEEHAHLAPQKETYLKDLASFMRDSHVVAYSMGARLVLWSLYAAGLTNGLLSLTLLSGHIGLQSERERRERYIHDVLLGGSLLQMSTKSYREFLVQWNKQEIFNGREMDEKELRLRGRAQPFGVGSSLVEYTTSLQPDISSFLGKVTFPTSFIVGSKDIKYKELASIAHRANPTHIDKMIIDGASHDVLSARPFEIQEKLSSTFKHFFDTYPVRS